MGRQVSIYVLCEPDETEEPRYAGQTVDIKRRYYEHVSKEIKTNLSNKRKQDWIRSLRDQGKLPLLKVLFVVDQTEADQAEKQVIEDMKLNGYDLLNGPFKVFGMWKAGWRCNVLKKPKIERVPKVRKERVPKPKKEKQAPIVTPANLVEIIKPERKYSLQEIVDLWVNGYRGHRRTSDTGLKNVIPYLDMLEEATTEVKIHNLIKEADELLTSQYGSEFCSFQDWIHPKPPTEQEKLNAYFDSFEDW